MKLTYQDFDQITVITIKGELTADQVETFRATAMSRLKAQTRDFVLHLAEVEFIDSKGLEALLWLQDQCAERLGQIRLAGAGENVRKILELTRLGARLECVAEVEEAVQSLR